MVLKAALGFVAACGLCLVVVRGATLLGVWASQCIGFVERGALGSGASVVAQMDLVAVAHLVGSIVVVHGFSCTETYGIFLDQDQSSSPPAGRLSPLHRLCESPDFRPVNTTSPS